MNSIIKEIGRAIGRQLDRFNTFIETPNSRKALVAVGIILIAIVFYFRSTSPDAIEKGDSVSVQIQTNPPGARIVLFEEDTGKITPTTFDLNPKRPYTFFFSLPGHDPAQAYWGPGETPDTLTIDLTPAADPEAIPPEE